MKSICALKKRSNSQAARSVGKLKLVELEEGTLQVPLISLAQLRGVFKTHEKLVRKGIRELDREHRERHGILSNTRD
jgi:hypothetical protein